MYLFAMELLAKTKIFKKFNYGLGENNIVEDYYLWTKMMNGITFTNVKEYLFSKSSSYFK